MNSRLCIGTAQLGMDYGIANSQGRPSYDQVRKMMQVAKDHGVREFDTAQAYGDSESVLGEALSHLNYKPEIITKLHPQFSYKREGDFEKSVLASLERLRCDRLFGILLHRPNFPERKEEFLRDVESVKQKGLVSQFGVSVYTPEEAIRFCEEPLINMIQIPANAFDRRWRDLNFFEFAKAKEKRIYVRSIFLQGLFLMDLDAVEKKGFHELIPHLREFHQLTRFYKISFSEGAVLLGLQSFPETHLVLGVESPEQLQENLKIFTKNEDLRLDVASWWAKVPTISQSVLDPRAWSQTIKN